MADDDQVFPNFVNAVRRVLLDRAPDLVTFRMLFHDLHTGAYQVAHHHPTERIWATDDACLQRPTPLMVWRNRDLPAFPDVDCGEDQAWAAEAVKGIRSHWDIPQLLYYYRCDTPNSVRNLPRG